MTIWWLTSGLCPRRSSIDPSGPQGTQGHARGSSALRRGGLCRSATPRPLGNVRGIYSDLLLHDLGPSLGDSGSSYGTEGPISPGGADCPASGAPRRCGVTAIPGPTSTTDGLRILEEAVALHGGQAHGSTRRFFALSAEERFQDRGVPEIAGRALGDCCGREWCLRPSWSPNSSWRRSALPRASSGGDGRRLWPAARCNNMRSRSVSAAKRRRGSPASDCKSLGTWKRVARLTTRLKFYTGIARECPDTDEGREATARIAEIRRARNYLFEDLSARWSPMIDGQ